MEGECDKSSEMVAENAPDLGPTEDLKLTKQESETVMLAEECQEFVKENVVPVTNGEVKNEKNGESAENVEQSYADSSKADEERTKPTEEAKESVIAKEVVKEVKESGGGSGGCSEEDDRNSVTSSQVRESKKITDT